MDYEKAFKEAYGRASLRFGTNVANELFLEYKESKEERTRRKLIEFFSDWSKTKSYCWGIRVTDIMDWLEKQGEQKPTEWSEEDEGFRNLLIAIMKFEHPEGVFEANGITPFCGTVSVHRVIDWLKSLKQRYTWKPSKEQMDAMQMAVSYFGYSWTSKEQKLLESLYKDLKKLTEG